MLWAKFKNLQRREKKALHRFLHNFTVRKDINVSLIKKPVVFIFYKYLLPHSFAHFNSNKFEFIRIKKSKTFIFLYLSQACEIFQEKKLKLSFKCQNIRYISAFTFILLFYLTKKNKKIIFHGSHKISKIKSNFFFIYYQLTNKELRNIPSFLYNALQCYKKQCSIL